jgi:hypothetical protein
MKRIVLFIAAMIVFSGYCFAQSGNNQVSVGGSADFLLGPGYRAAYNVGFGGGIKGLYGLGEMAQVTLSVAYSSFGGKSGTLYYTNQTLSLLPILAGYRYYLPNHFYAEGQAGIGFLTQQSPSYTYTQTNPAAGLSAGVIMDGFDLSARFYTEGSVMNQFAIRLAYNFSLK